MWTFVFIVITFILLLSMAFFLASKFNFWDSLMSSSFECGFSSYFFSRFSFSVHYFLLGLIFLFLDLELCVVMPFLNSQASSLGLFLNLMILVFMLLAGLIIEWKEMKLEWNY